jgi:murein DD-endopeptidase MepM/ murein hydrolase activator NlpD
MYRFAITALALWANSTMAQEYLLKPVDATCISSSFGPRTIRNHPEAGTFHFGLDFPAPEGSPVWAIEAGTLVKVQQNGPGGLEVLVQHSGFVGIYSHLGSVSPRVLAARTPIASGEFLGVVGHSGLTFGPHLYFGMLHDGFPIDPSSLFDLPRCHDTVLAGRR